MENGEAVQGDPTDNERPPSILQLQGALKRVSQSPFRNQYMNLVPSTSDSCESSLNDSLKNQNGVLNRGACSPFPLSPQNDGGLTRDNPFYAHFVESSSKPINMEDMKRETSKEPGLSTILAPQPVFLSLPLDSAPATQTLENTRTKSLDPQKDLFQTPDHSRLPDPFHTLTVPQSNPLNESPSQGASLNSADPFKATPSRPNSFLATLTRKDSLQATSTNDLDLFYTPPDTLQDPFLSPSNKEEDIFQSRYPKDADLFHLFEVPSDKGVPTSTKENDLFHIPSAGVGSVLSRTDVPSSTIIDPFPPSLNMSDPFGPFHPFKDPFGGTTDVFVPPKTSLTPFEKQTDRFHPSPSIGSSGTFHTISNRSTPRDTSSFNGSPVTPLDVFSPSFVVKSPDLFKAAAVPPPALTTNVSGKPLDVVRTTPHGGTKYDILQPTPIIQARAVSMSAEGELESEHQFSSKAINMEDMRETSKEPGLSTFAPPPEFLSLPLDFAPALATNAPGKPHDVAMTTPRGTKYDILRPTPFIQAMSPEGELQSEHAFRRPSKPLPRRKPSRRVNPIVPAPKPAPKPASKPPPKPPPKPAPKPPPKPEFKPPQRPFTYIGQTVLDNPPEEAANDAVFEDVLLIGQERCVEDWPEDSPQHDPQFKPSGTLRLRRESLKIDSDGGSGEDQKRPSGTRKLKKLGRRFSVSSLLTRRGSKDKITDEPKDGKCTSLPRRFRDKITDEPKDGKCTSLPRRFRLDSKDDDGNRTSQSSKDLYGLQEEDLPPYLHGGIYSPLGEDVEKNGMDDKKPNKPLKAKVSQILRRASASPVLDKYNGHVTQGSKGSALDESFEDEDENEESVGNGFGKKRVTVKFVPQRGFAISLEKDHLEPKGAHGHTPSTSSKDDVFLDEGGATGYTPHCSTSEEVFQEDGIPQKGADLFYVGKLDEDQDGSPEYYKPQKKPSKFTSYKKHKAMNKAVDTECDHPPGATSKDYYLSEAAEKTKPKLPLAIRRKSKTSCESPLSQYPPRRPSNEAFQEDCVPQKGADLFCAGELDEDQDGSPDYYKPKKPSKFKSYKKHKAMNKAVDTECDHPPGATSKDYYLSEAAEAEWLAAQTDLAAGSEDGEEDGDTDSLMEWWNTVEQWDELPSDDEDMTMKVDEIKSFTVLADKVQRGLRVFNKVFTEHAEVFWQSVITLHAIADDISAFHKKAKIANISGGTTSAVGGVAAIAGLALAPLTMGVSLIVTAVGVGVAAAGGITSASATISDNVNNMHDRKKVEVELQEYEAHLLDVRKILHFVNQGLFQLRGHPFLRAGTQHYSEDWEVRRAVQIISLVDGPVMRAAEITDEGVSAVQGLFEGMDKYFIKDSRELKKGCKKEVVGQIKAVANVLNDGLVELNSIREELQDASGNM